MDTRKGGQGMFNKTYAEYKQREITEKGEKTANVLGRHIIKLYSIWDFSAC